ncbi:ABATE domain-containing protein [Actinomadura sp. DC4]|uniref:CGNR zinc finger domain-containing protein n=1 Tax=Actinomadura sp. DC4 TaxID=3055069 RepID=UPI0025AFEE6A|nr:ABATE domain-containing protein [Actinomadura sp. DC4]MDN3356699.1 ABATE domain-containing protein [Actinomadura sp. DC4]
MGDWVWDGGRPSIDLLNTARDRVIGPRETLRTPEDLARWLREADLLDAPVDEAALNAARRLRAAIDALAFATPEEADAAVVNAMAADAPRGPRITVNESRVVPVPPSWSAASALGQVALDAIDLLTGNELLRVCAADDCGIRFADRSPARNRQWCSMRRCGNRTKARRHYASRTP